MRIVIWHVHGGWMNAFVRGDHEYLLPVRRPGGAGGAQDGWPPGVREVTPAQLRDADVDVVVLQRLEEIDLAREWLGRRPGVDVPAVYHEHNTPGGDVCRMRHPLADQTGLPIVHVTHFNRLYWDNGRAAASVIEPGIPDPGHLFTGEIPAAAVVINEPIRRGRATGTDLLAEVADAVDLDVYGMKVDGLADHLGRSPRNIRERGDLPQAVMHQEIARRRVYFHPNRWTSVGMALIEAMMLGLPPVVLAATESGPAVPPGGGVASTRPDVLSAAALRYVSDPALAAEEGAQARRAALERFSLDRFLADWDRLFKEVCA